MSDPETTQVNALSASDEMIRLLGLDKPAVEPTLTPLNPPSPVVSDVQEVVKDDKPETPTVTTVPPTTVSIEPLVLTAERLDRDYEEPTARSWFKSAVGSLLTLVPYVLIFIIGVVVYYVFFASPSNRPAVLSVNNQNKPTPLQAKAENLTVLQKEQDATFKEWLKKYYFDISDEALLDPNRVTSNKLTNFENYLLELNPRTNDIRKTGRPDAAFILEGTDPNTGLPLKDAQKDAIAKYFDLAAIKERLANLPAMPSGTVNSASTPIMPRGPQRADYVAPDSNLPSSQGSFQNQLTNNNATQPASASPAPKPASNLTPKTSLSTPTPAKVAASSATSPKLAPVTGPAGCEENKLGIDTSIPGRLEIPSIGVNVPIIWTKTSNDFNQDLKIGVVHYPCTPLPGDVGKSYISGHSSNYTWAGGSYNKVFTRMNELQAGMTFKITVVGKDGRDQRLFYVIQSKQEYEAGDQAQFTNTAYSEVALSTCWPINTTKLRLVTVARLDRIEK